MIYLVCYDITDYRRLRKTAKTLENFGLRVQKSFFQCDVSAEKIQEIQQRVLKIINIKQDKFYIYPLCEECAKNAITDGTGNLIKVEDFEIL